MDSVSRAGFFGRRRHWALALLALAFVTSCGHGPTAPSPPPVASITLTCPADIHLLDVATPIQAVDYQAPTATGGVPPISISCSPPSGSSFALGSTVVTCEATDGQRRATCPFTVRLDPLPILRFTRFMAFGDSITAGELQRNGIRAAVERDKAYPTVLSQLLSARYHTQSITMFNEGFSGESAEMGASRIGGALRSDNPDVLLLMQGVIDLGRGTPFITRVITALRDDITQARARGVREIFLGTLLPQKPHLPGFPANEIAMPYIEEANTEIRALASQEGVNLVDLYAALAPNVATNIGGDGLHPTEEGFIAVAQTFFDAIKSKLEVASTAPAAGRTITRSSSRLR